MAEIKPKNEKNMIIKSNQEAWSGKAATKSGFFIQAIANIEKVIYKKIFAFIIRKYHDIDVQWFL